MAKYFKKRYTIIMTFLVISIIGTLTGVLAKENGLMGNSTRNASVKANVNIVKVYLETTVLKENKTVDLRNALINEFTGVNSLKNPFNNSLSIAAGTLNRVDSMLQNSAAIAVCIVKGSMPKDITLMKTNENNSQVVNANKGTVFVYYYSQDKCYAVFGIDGSGRIINTQIIK